MKCYICKGKVKPFKQNNAWPFCSQKCKDVDLYHWFNEEYTYFDEEEVAPVKIVDVKGEN